MPDTTDVERPRERRDLYWDLLDFSRGRGLEIGPLHRTIVPRSEADVRYVDVHDQAALRAHYEGDPAVDPALIPEIDFTLIKPDGTAVSLSEATAAGAPFDWVVASHVVEHVPDVIGWLADIAEIATDGARLVLAVPDRRFCFDVLRPPTTVGQMIQAHHDGDTRPSVRAVYDYFTGIVAGDARALWAGRLPSHANHLYSLAEADAKVQSTVDGTYVDCHLWLFTPESFAEQMRELRLRGRSQWVVERVVPTVERDLEFKVVMRRIARGSDATGPQPGEVDPALTRPEWVEPSALQLEVLVARIEHLEKRLRDRRDLLRSVRTRARRREERAARQIARLRHELDTVRRSPQWRAGGAALLPVRTIRRLRRS